ncbi:MAG: HEPN domain-containing protein [Dysgonamonadaceae bacterium]|jgi:uncharacterized protein (UPF0332 family)|nr:HEPN domain-containing protein [Dysgonamonadaceae bacterium]
MKLSKEEREAVVVHRLQKAKDTLHEAKGNIELAYWHTAANRLYYACYYAASALLIKNGYIAQTHSGVVGLLGMHFISKGIISKEMGKFYLKIFELRQTGDYSDWIAIESVDVQPFVEPAEKFIDTVEKLIS